MKRVDERGFITLPVYTLEEIQTEYAYGTAT
jgi:hypothetical protein